MNGSGTMSRTIRSRGGSLWAKMISRPRRSVRCVDCRNFQKSSAGSSVTRTWLTSSTNSGGYLARVYELTFLLVRDPEANATWRPLGWRQTLLMNFGPAAITFAAVLALAPLLARLGLPRYFSFTVAETLVLTPIELGLPLRAAHRATGRWSLRALPSVIAYRRPLTRRVILLVPVLFGLALAVAAAYAAVSSAIGGGL